MNTEVIVNIEHVTKEYRLGAIGGGTLKGDLQSFIARIQGKENPNAKVGQDVYAKNQKFLALNDVTFKVYKGERVGIIGHNGAGKSTLLKLLSRVTAPTKGRISHDGRIASMLEVGTGFHPELTGRENVYLNGAILGMTKAEIDKKFDDIVAFAEMEKFIDTPVKRYSSGMYVKLAFAVAAHLDSEILVMDEVLAVGDMKFQEKCLSKMENVSKNDGKTVLYVSHNMNTIRELCSRCVVLDHGRIIFDGDVEQAISIYMNHYVGMKIDCYLSSVSRPDYLPKNMACKILHARLASGEHGRIAQGESVEIVLTWECMKDISDLKFRIEIRALGKGICVAFQGDGMSCKRGNIYVKRFKINVDSLSNEIYETMLVLYRENMGYSLDLDCVPGVTFQKVITGDSYIAWNPGWGNICLPNITCEYS